MTSELTALQRLDELTNYVSVFNIRACDGTAYQAYNPRYPGVHNYAIQSIVQPQRESWQPTGTVPNKVACSIHHFRVDELTPHELGRVHREFERMACGLEATLRFLEGVDTTSAAHLRRNLTESLPDIHRFVERTGQRYSALTAERT